MAHLETVELHHQAPNHFLLRLTSDERKSRNNNNEDGALGEFNDDDHNQQSSSIRVVSLDHSGAGGDDLVRNCIFPLLMKQKTMKVIIGHKETDAEGENAEQFDNKGNKKHATSSGFKFAPASLSLQHLTSDIFCIQDVEMRSILSLLFRKQCVMSQGAVFVAKVTKVLDQNNQKALFLKLGSGNTQALAPFPVSKQAEGNIALIKPFSGIGDDEDEDEDDNDENNNNKAKTASFKEDISPRLNDSDSDSSDDDDNKAKTGSNTKKNTITTTKTNNSKNSDAITPVSISVGDSVSARVLYVASSNNAIVACSVAEKVVNRAPMNRRELANAFLSSSTIGVGKSVSATILLHCSSEENYGVSSHLAVGEVIVKNDRSNNNKKNNDTSDEDDDDDSTTETSVLVYIRLGPVKKAAQLREKYPVRAKVQVALQFIPNESMLDALPFCIGQLHTDARPFLQVACAPHRPLFPRHCALLKNNKNEVDSIFKPISGIQFQQFVDPLFVDMKEKEKEDGDNKEDDLDEHGNSKSRIRRRELEEAIDAFERQGEVIPTTTDGFRKLLLSSPQSSYIWIRYMAFLVSLSKIDEAKDIAEQALTTINARDTGSERLNIFTAYMNLENLHGTAESLSAIFTRALAHTDKQLSVYERLAHIFRATKKKDQLLQLCRTMTSKFASETKVWELLCYAYIEQEKREALRRTIRQIQGHPSLKMADKTLILQHIAVFEYKSQNPTHGRALFETLVSQKAKRSDVWNVFLDQEMALLARGDPSSNVVSIRKLFQRASSVQLPPRAMQQLMSRFLKFEQQHGTSADVERVKEAAQKYVQERLAAASSGNSDGADINSIPQGFRTGNSNGNNADGTNLLEDSTNQMLQGGDDDDNDYDNNMDGGVFDQL